MDRGAWRVTVSGVAKIRTRLSNWAQCTLSYVLSRLWSQELFNMPPPKQQTLKHELMFIHFDSLACSVIQSCMTLCNPMDYIVHQALLLMTFSKQEYWSELPFLSPDVLVTQLYPTICGPIDYSPSSSYVNWISQARILELVVIPFSRGFSRPTHQTQVSCTVGRFFTIWATKHDFH